MNIWFINHYGVPPEYYPLARQANFAKYLKKLGHNVTIFAASSVHNSDKNLISGKEKYKIIDKEDAKYVLIKCKNYKGNGLSRILNMIEFGMDIQSAINSPRAYCFTTNESNRGDSSKAIYIENGLNQIKDELTSFSYNVTSYGDQQIHSYFGGVQGIKVESNAYHGGADPRRDGKALGF